MIRRAAKSLLFLVLLGATSFAPPAFAASYPVSATWTYDDVTGKGPAPNCGKRQMEFSGSQRRDTEGGVHEYRNVSVDDIGSDAWRITDEFFNGQAWGRVTFTLNRQDNDHIEIKMARGGKTFRLRRCA
jgi:hypothetical protein